MVMVGGDSYYWHSKAVTGVSAMLYAETTLLSGIQHSTYVTWFIFVLKVQSGVCYLLWILKHLIHCKYH